MSFLTKSIMATIFLGTGLVAVICMLTLMGKAERKISATTLRRLHKIFGFIFLALLLVISYFCLAYVRMAGEHLSVRAVFHGVLALSLFIVLALKVAIVQFYREFIRFVPAMGMTVFALAFLVYCTSAGFFFLGASRASSAKARERPPAVSLSGDAENGRLLFEDNCSFCHHADRIDTKIGPGLREVLKKERLPFSGRLASPESVRRQLMNPIRDMPSFSSSLSEQQIEDLLAYLKTL